MDERFDSEKIDDAVLAMLFLTQAGGGPVVEVAGLGRAGPAA